MALFSLTLALVAGAVGCAPCDGRVAVAGPVPVAAVRAAPVPPSPAAPAPLVAAPAASQWVAASPVTPLSAAPVAPPSVAPSAPEPIRPEMTIPGAPTPVAPSAPAPDRPTTTIFATSVVPARPLGAPVEPRATPDVPSPHPSSPPPAEVPAVPVEDRAAPRSPGQADRVPVRVAQVPSSAASPTPQPSAPSPQTPAPQPTEDDGGLRILVMTMGPGDAVWERFGHNAIWIHDPEAGTDLAYNYGLFDFAEADFVQRFVQGRMLYWMDGFDAYRTIEHYAGQNRDVWVQELALTPAQKRELRDFLVWNSRPENRFYRYDYYRDNCSTRVRDAIDRVLGGRLRTETEGEATGTTYRSHTARLTAGSVPEYSGLMIGLGPPADRPIDAWEEMFLPMRLRDRLAEMQTVDAAGRTVPLVKWDTLAAAAMDREPARTEPPFRIPWYGLGGLLLGAALVLLARGAPRSGAARFGFAALASLWLILVSTAGVVLVGLWGWTDHAIAYANENLFQFTPLAIPLVLLVPLLAYGARWAARPAAWLMLAVAGLSLLGLLVQLLPGLDQANGEVVAMALPVHLGLAWAVLRLRDAVLTRPAPTRIAKA